MAAKGPREKIKMVSTGKRKNGKPTGYYYTTLKNKRNTPDKLVRKKYDPRAWNEATGKYGKHVDFKEGKIK